MNRLVFYTARICSNRSNLILPNIGRNFGSVAHKHDDKHSHAHGHDHGHGHDDHHGHDEHGHDSHGHDEGIPDWIKACALGAFIITGWSGVFITMTRKLEDSKHDVVHNDAHTAHSHH